MAETKIEWATYTFNPWMGCTKVSLACKHCYAERDFDLHYKKVQWGPNGTRVLTSDANWKKPLKWNRDASFHTDLGAARPRVFCASLADVFEDWQGDMFDASGSRLWIDRAANGNAGYLKETPQGSFSGCRPVTMSDVRSRLFDLIDATPHLDWLLLTKRPENILKMWPKVFCDNHICEAASMSGVACPHDSCDVEDNVRQAGRKNVWLGTSVENQEMADKRIPELLKCRDLSPVLFLSCEPLLGPVDLERVLHGDSNAGVYHGTLRGDYKVDWVIAGGESGPNARPSHPDWLRSLRDQCTNAGVPFHFKQWGEWAPYSDLMYERCKSVDTHAFDEEANVFRVGKSQAGRLLDGVLHDEFPKGGSC